MAEGLLGGILGSEGEKPEVEAPEALAGAEAFAAAVAARLSSSDPEVARDTSAFLKKQTQILDTQNRHLEDEHALRVAHLRNQLSEESIRRFGLRLRIGFQLFLVLVATVIGLGVAVMIRDAFASRSVVIDSFDVSPGLAAQALDGRIVAAAVHDRLTQLQSATRISAQKREISDAWTNEISIDVPETGLNFGQIERVLKTRFGHDQHISGTLVKTGSEGLTLTVRGTDVLPRTFTDSKGDFNALVTQAAEYVYGESQPGLFVHYLANDAGRYQDTIAFAKSHLARASADDKPLLLNYWANALNGLGGGILNAQSLPLYEEAVRIKPDYWIGWGNIINTLDSLGDEEGAIRTSLQMMKVAGGRPGKALEQDYGTYDLKVYNLQTYRAALLAEISATGGVTAIWAEEGLLVALADVQLHEIDTARMRVATTSWDPESHFDAMAVANTQALIDQDIGDLRAAAKSWDDFATLWSDPGIAFNTPSTICWAAPTYEKAAQPAKADAALAAPLKVVGISTYVDCYRFKGDVLELRGDWAGAQEWYAKAVKLAPSMPSGYYSWGLALLKHGDLQGATEKFRLANQKGPNWADPLKAWGDVLVKQNNAKDALAKYDEALKYAPNWKQLREARDSAARAKV